MASGVIDCRTGFCGMRPPAPAAESWHEAQCFWNSCAPYGSSAARTRFCAIKSGATAISHILMERPPCPRQDLLDYSGFGVGVVLSVLPIVFSQSALRPLIQLPVAFVGAQPVAKLQHAVNFGAARREDV